MNTGHRVGDVMSKVVAQISISSTIVECAKEMAQKRIGSLVVMQENKPIGIITEQDLGRKVMAQGVNPNVTSVERVMSQGLHTIGSEKDIYDAMVMMGQQKIKHLPVVEEERLVGIISFKDILRIQPTLIELLNFKHS
jgi:signal-transduction protein with cAMP-binding, CBS, and nucleotidyltransferase domain